MKIYWDDFTLGENDKPENWEQMKANATDAIDSYIATNQLNRWEDEEQIIAYSESLAEDWITHGIVKWYAVLRDQDDNDWGTGSYDYDTAIEMAKAYGEEARIAVIQEGSDPVCIDVISSENF